MNVSSPISRRSIERSIGFYWKSAQIPDCFCQPSCSLKSCFISVQRRASCNFCPAFTRGYFLLVGRSGWSYLITVVLEPQLYVTDTSVPATELTFLAVFALLPSLGNKPCDTLLITGLLARFFRVDQSNGTAFTNVTAHWVLVA